MKSKDLALIALIAGFSGIFAFVLSNMFLAAPKNLVTPVEVVEAIDPDFKFPDKKYFNDESINPTRAVQIGESQNQNPFSQSQ